MQDNQRKNLAPSTHDSSTTSTQKRKHNQLQHLQTMRHYTFQNEKRRKQNHNTITEPKPTQSTPNHTSQDDAHTPPFQPHNFIFRTRKPECLCDHVELFGQRLRAAACRIDHRRGRKETFPVRSMQEVIYQKMTPQTTHSRSHQ